MKAIRGSVVGGIDLMQVCTVVKAMTITVILSMTINRLLTMRNKEIRCVVCEPRGSRCMHAKAVSGCHKRRRWKILCYYAAMEPLAGAH